MIRIKYRRLRLWGKWFLVVGGLGVVTVPIIVLPMLNPEPYKEIQKIGRKDIIQKNVQPGNMRLWTDPFDRRK